MFINTAFAVAMVFIFSLSTTAQETTASKPAELAALKASVGVWDAEFEVWSQGPDAPSMKFKGVETNTAFGKYWIASDLDTEFMGQTMKVHSIIGYDLDKKKMVGTVVDSGPYSASMTGTYRADTRTFHWQTNAKDPEGKPMIQKTTITHESDDKRVLVLSVPNEQGNGFTKLMQIVFEKRK